MSVVSPQDNGRDHSQVLLVERVAIEESVKVDQWVSGIISVPSGDRSLFVIFLLPRQQFPRGRRTR